MQTPADGVPPQLLPHMHLLSKHRYPTIQSLSLEAVLDYLLQGVQIAKAGQPMYWQVLDAPADGTLMLVWQPLAQLQNHFASDGYIWADEEQTYALEVKGYTVEMLLHRAGYRPPETMAAHTRKRYRLIPNPARPLPPGAPRQDHSLYLVHYTRAAPVDTIPSNRIPLSPAVHQQLSVRRWLQSQGQLARKEFMLHDKEQWPTINMPPHPQVVRPLSTADAQANSGLVRQQQVQPQVPQQQPGLPPQHALAQRQPSGFAPNTMPPNVVAKGTPAPAARPHAHGPESRDTTLLDEDDVSKGDILDFLTPREISKVRYQQHHEWMEEIYSSLYSTEQIIPPSLGLGRKGELSDLTRGFFEVPTVLRSAKSQDEEESSYSIIGKMEDGKAEEFKARATARMASIKEDIQKMKKRHADRMEKLSRNSQVFKDAEYRLREAASDSASGGKDIWKIGQSEEATESASTADPKKKEKISQVVAEVEAKTGKSLEMVSAVSCVQKGGLQEKLESEFEDIDESFLGDVDMTTAEAELQPQPSKPAGDGDVEMSEVSNTAPTKVEGTGDDWVMVNKDGTSKTAEPTAQYAQPAGVQSNAGSAIPPPTNPPAAATASHPTSAGQQAAAAVHAPSTVAPTPAPAANNPVSKSLPNDGTPNMEGSEFDDSTFGHLDSAGEALAQYDNDLELDGLDDSAFGEAFSAGGHGLDGNQG